MASDDQKNKDLEKPSLEDSSEVKSSVPTKGSEEITDKETEQTKPSNSEKIEDGVELQGSTDDSPPQTDHPDQAVESPLQPSDQAEKTQGATDSEDLEEETVTTVVAEEETVVEEILPELYLNGLYAIKLGMSSVYNDQGQIVPVTVLRFDTWKVTQIKTKEKDGYNAIQLGSRPKSERKSNLSQKGHLKPSGFQTNVTFLREIRGDIPSQPSEENEKAEGTTSQDTNESSQCQLGQVLSIRSLAKGDRVHLSAISKGRGFAGTMKRLGYSGGPASHGSQFHRKPGSIGMCEEPARVLPGKGMPGHHGSRNVTLKHVEVVKVIPEKKVLLVKGSVPGGRNSLVKLMKESV